MANLYAIVSEQFPEFVRSQYPVFVEFVKSYYKWMDENYPSNYGMLIDIDETASDYVQFFKNALDVDGLLSNIFDIRYLKYIKEIYSTKGSEQSLVRLLEIVHDADVSVDYPGKYVLRASDGKWNQESFITVNVLFGQLPDTPKFFYIKQQQITKIVEITRVEELTSGQIRIFFKKKTQLNISSGDYVELKDNDTIVFTGSVVSVPATLEIVDGGTGWQLGQIFTIYGSVKNSVGKVTKVDSSGTIQKAIIYVHGEGHTYDQEFTTSSINTTNATLKIKYGVVPFLEGKWADDSGKLSNEVIRLQDSFYYQQFSYVIDSDINSSKYIKTAINLNPAGLKLFTNYNRIDLLESDIDGSTTFPFIDLLLGPHFVNVSDNWYYHFTDNSIIPPSLCNTEDSISFEFGKGVSDTATINSSDSSNRSIGMYAAEDYFLEEYNAAEVTLNIGD